MGLVSNKSRRQPTLFCADERVGKLRSEWELSLADLRGDATSPARVRSDVVF